MLYLFIDTNRIKVLSVKKTLLGQYESAFYEKQHAVTFLNEDGTVANTDLLASAIKEATSSLSSGQKDKETCLILPQQCFQFMRTEVPVDLAPSAVSSFVNDKARAHIAKDVDSYHYDYLVQDNEKQKQIIFFALDKEVLSKYQEGLSLVDLQLSSIIPESLAFFKLFEKTLRKDKKENIMYVTYEQDELSGLLFDSFGPMEDKKWKVAAGEKTSVEDDLKKKAGEYEKDGKKLNRIILSGDQSETIRQDTFTKNVGVWTNPLKRIIPHFYQDYLKIFIIPSNQTLPLLQYDACIGAFIFALENKNFSLLKKKLLGFSKPSLSAPRLSLPKREIVIFIVSFALSLGSFIVLSRLNMSLPDSKNLPLFAAKPTMTPTPLPPTPTPTVAINKKELKIKVLNGSGIAGKATQVKDVLTEHGYEEILTGNADNFEYEQTEIMVKEDKEDVIPTVKKDLSEHVTNPKVTKLDEEEASDIVIIFGSDFK
jgi:hypothetical protein